MITRRNAVRRRLDWHSRPEETANLKGHTMAKRERVTYNVRAPKRVCGIMEPGTWVVEVRGPRWSGRGSTNVYVSTWADGFGTWHARFSTTDNPRRDAHVARVAIGYELACREGASAALSFHVRRRYSRTDLPGAVHYAEVGA